MLWFVVGLIVGLTWLCWSIARDVRKLKAEVTELGRRLIALDTDLWG